MGYLVFSTYNSYHLWTEMILLLPCWFGCLYFSCLIAVTRTSSTVLKKNGKSEPPYLVANLRGNAFSFTLLSICSLWVFHIRLLECWGSFPLFWFVECFYHKRVLNFIKCFFCVNRDDHVGFFTLHSVNVVYYIDPFSYIEPSLHSRNKSHLVMVYNPFNILLNLVS